MSLETFSVCQIHTANEEGRNLQKVLALNSGPGLGSWGPSYRLWLFLDLPSTQHQATVTFSNGFLLPMKPRSASSHPSPCSQT